jgi:hypothetical protein
LSSALQVGEQPQFFQRCGGQVLGLVDDQQGAQALLVHLREELH